MHTTQRKHTQVTVEGLDEEERLRKVSREEIYLQEEVEDIRVGLLDFIKQHQAVGVAPDCLSEHTPISKAVVAWWRAYKLADGVLLHAFAHVDAHQVVLHTGDLCWGQYGATGKVFIFTQQS